MLKFGESPMAAHRRRDARQDSARDAEDRRSGAARRGCRAGRVRAPAGFSVVLDVMGPVEGKRVFQALAEGGAVRVPFQATFWSPGYGMLVDRFGVPWEINSE